MNVDCSIIIPVFNAEKTVLRTISAIREISGVAIEIILVNDGSTDSSLEICKQQSMMDKRIVVYSQKNKGVSAARNRGIEIANGKFIYFIDADDTIMPEVIKSIIEAMNYYNLDLSISNYKEYNELLNTECEILLNLPYNILLDRQFIKKDIFKRLYLGENIGLSNIWNKIFRNHIIKEYGIKFEENRTHGEDWKFVIDYLAYVKNLMVFPEILYVYHLDGSQVIKKYRKGLLQSIVNAISIKEVIRKSGDFDLTKEQDHLVIINQFVGILNFLKSNPTKNERHIIKNNNSIKTLSQKILFLPISSVRNTHMSRTLYLIAFCLRIGFVSISIKLIKRGF